MPWEKAFDTDQALAKAMEAFWAHGYEATSMQALVDAMGIGRGSLYATFGDKHSLFVQALRRYDQHYREDWSARLAASHSPRQAIIAVFDETVASALDGGSCKGCLLINTALELSPHDDEIGEIVRHCLLEMEAFFREQLEKAKAAGEVAPSLSADEVAKSLLALLVSLRVFARARPEAGLLKAVASQAEALMI
ncbi:MAG: TetR/AcrR family transcriptional regulator [Geminicoccaceae bacterium]